MMPNRQLTKDELNDLFYPLHEEVKVKLEELGGGDAELHWALRRKLWKELSYDERGKPAYRAQLKRLKRDEQDGLCPECHGSLPDKYAVLDRIKAMDGYTEENTRLLCPDCDRAIQAERRYK